MAEPEVVHVNPALTPCSNQERGGVHNWFRRADGTASCLNCAKVLDKVQCAIAFPVALVPTAEQVDQPAQVEQVEQSPPPPPQRKHARAND